LSKFTIIIFIFHFLLNPSLFGGNVIPFKLVNNLIIIQVDIETNSGNFILDTGSDAIFLNTDFANVAGKISEFNTMNGEISSEATKISFIKIGDIIKRNISAYNANLDNIEKYLSLEIRGIIGAELFNPHSIYIDFFNKEIHFFKRAPSLSDFDFINSFDFKMILGVPTVELTIENKKYTFIMDSGASIHIMDPNVILSHPEHFDKLTSNVKVEALGNTSNADISKYNIKSFYIGSAYLPAQTCLVKDFSEFNIEGQLIISGIISISRLTEKGLLLDFHRMKMYY